MALMMPKPPLVPGSLVVAVVIVVEVDSFRVAQRAQAVARLGGGKAVAAQNVPAPVASLLLEHIANHDNMDTATNPASQWLFPGRRADQPFRPDHLSALLNKVGVPAAAARGAAIRQQLLLKLRHRLEEHPKETDHPGHGDKDSAGLRGTHGMSHRRLYSRRPLTGAAPPSGRAGRKAAELNRRT